MLKPFAAVTQAQTLEQLQRALQITLRDIRDSAILNGNIVDVVFSSSANSDLLVMHGLSRVAIGYIPVSLSAAGIIYSSPTAVRSPLNEIILRSNTASLTATLWVF